MKKSIFIKLNGVSETGEELSLSKEGREAGRQAGWVWNRRGEELPLLLSPMQAGTASGQQFHFNNPSRFSYCSSWHTMVTARFSHTHRNMAQTSHTRYRIHRMHHTGYDPHLIKMQGSLAGQLLYFLQISYLTLQLTFRLKQILFPHSWLAA